MVFSCRFETLLRPFAADRALPTAFFGVENQWQSRSIRHSVLSARHVQSFRHRHQAHRLRSPSISPAHRPSIRSRLDVYAKAPFFFTYELSLGSLQLWQQDNGHKKLLTIRPGNMRTGLKEPSSIGSNSLSGFWKTRHSHKMPRCNLRNYEPFAICCLAFGTQQLIHFLFGSRHR